MKTPFILAAALAAFLPVRASAETIYASTLFRNLVSFDSSAPGTFLTNVPISGLGDPFEQLIGIDFRPSTGVLYGIGNAPGSLYRLYTLDTATGVATRVGSTDLTLSGSYWGMEFDPVSDQIRIVSDTNTHVRVNPLTGVLSGTDAAINPFAFLFALAYDRNDTNPGTPSTLYGIDAVTDRLLRVGSVDGTPTSPDTGLVTNIGPLGFDTDPAVGFDISGTGIAYAALSTAGDPFSPQLATIDLSTGAATVVGQIGNGSDGVIGLAVQSVPEPGSAALLGLAGVLLGLRRRRQA